jgi:hypothetical protein
MFCAPQPRRRGEEITRVSDWAVQMVSCANFPDTTNSFNDTVPYVDYYGMVFYVYPHVFFAAIE